MSQVLQGRATLSDLAQVSDKAELIAGRIVRLMATGRRPNRVALRICRSLDDYAERTGQGEAYTDNMGFTVPMLPSGRESFSPDAAYFAGPFVDDAMRFISSAPTLAVEVRSDNDYGAAAELEMAAKRADYFQAGSLVVWDVDCEADTISVYRASDPTRPTIYSRGQMAEAQPAVPGWSVSVDWVFDVAK